MFYVFFFNLLLISLFNFVCVFPLLVNAKNMIKINLIYFCIICYWSGRRGRSGGRYSNSNSTFIALNLCQRADSKAQWTKHNSIFMSRDIARVMHHWEDNGIWSEMEGMSCCRGMFWAFFWTWPQKWAIHNILILCIPLVRSGKSNTCLLDWYIYLLWFVTVSDVTTEENQCCVNEAYKCFKTLLPAMF